MRRRQGGERTLVASPVGSVEHTLLDGKGVHAVDLDAGEVVAPLVVLGRSRGPLDGGTHAVLVVLAHEDGGKLHTRGEVSTTIMFSFKGQQVESSALPSRERPCCTPRKADPGWRHRHRTWRQRRDRSAQAPQNEEGVSGPKTKTRRESERERAVFSAENVSTHKCSDRDNCIFSYFVHHQPLAH